MSSAGEAENFIESTSGCGPFQVIVLVVVVLITMPALSYTMVFMSFGNYNPGWRCLDDDVTTTTTTTTITTTTTNTSLWQHPIDLFNTSTSAPPTTVGSISNELQYTVGSCDAYRHCLNVEFNPETSTIVSEWGLLCDNAWMSPMTISIQMVGMLTGSIVSGQVADMFGRKKTLYGSVALCGVMQLVSTFSVSWGMFAVFVFFFGALSVTNIIIVMIYVSEVMTKKWRGFIIVLPFWYIGATLLAIAALVTKNWRHIQFFGFALHVVSFIPVVWVPESLRWLEAKRKSEKFNLVAKKIAKYNKTSHSPTLDNDSNGEINVVVGQGKKYTIIDIFRHGYAMISICLGLITGIFSIVFYSTTFATKSLYGDFYVNQIVSTSTGIPVFFLPLLAMKYLNRKSITFLTLIISALSVFSATGLLFCSSEAAKSIGSTVLISVTRALVNFTWLCLYLRVTEIYPTIVRGIAVGYSSLTARVTGIIAPFVIPESQDKLYIFTAMSGVALLICCILSIGLPETKGKPLKERFDDGKRELS